MSNYMLLGLGFSLDPVIQTDTSIKQCRNFSRDSLKFETGPSTEHCGTPYESVTISDI